MKKSCLLFVLLICISSAHAFFSSPGQTIAAQGTIQLAFTPGDKADEMIIDVIARSHKQIYVQAFSFTHKKIAQALIQAKHRGVDVQLIADRQQTQNMQNSVVPTIAAAGVAVFIDSDHDSAHNKVMILDPGSKDAAVITGSYNFTHAAQYKNAENVMVIRGNPEMANAYLNNWKRHREHARPY